VKHEDGIHEGDTVDIYFVRNDAIFDGVVLSTPASLMEPFVVREKNGRITYVQMYETISKTSCATPNATTDGRKT
jgi:hypothetical protein